MDNRGRDFPHPHRRKIIMKKIIHWTIKIRWNDDKEEYLSDIPDAIAKPVDSYLDEIQSRRNEEEATEGESQ